MMTSEHENLVCLLFLSKEINMLRHFALMECILFHIVILVQLVSLRLGVAVHRRILVKHSEGLLRRRFLA